MSTSNYYKFTIEPDHNYAKIKICEPGRYHIIGKFRIDQLILDKIINGDIKIISAHHKNGKTKFHCRLDGIFQLDKDDSFNMTSNQSNFKLFHVEQSENN